jgi:ATP adenylyltransferase
MDHLWTPWRFHYISSSGKVAGCVFCDLLREQPAKGNLVLARHVHNYVVLNRFPYTSGHLLVVAHRHIAQLTDASEEALEEMILLARQCESALQEVYRCDGLNIGFNIGRSAGAGVAGHLHLHVVPRWHGDANFVSVVGQTRVIPEDLETTYDKLTSLLSHPSRGNHPNRQNHH